MKFISVVEVDGYVYGLFDGILECVCGWFGERMWKGGCFGYG